MIPSLPQEIIDLILDKLYQCHKPSLRNTALVSRAFTPRSQEHYFQTVEFGHHHPGDKASFLEVLASNPGMASIIRRINVEIATVYRMSTIGHAWFGDDAIFPELVQLLPNLSLVSINFTDDSSNRQLQDWNCFSGPVQRTIYCMPTWTNIKEMHLHHITNIPLGQLENFIHLEAVVLTRTLLRPPLLINARTQISKPKPKPSTLRRITITGIQTIQFTADELFRTIGNSGTTCGIELVIYAEQFLNEGLTNRLAWILKLHGSLLSQLKLSYEHDFNVYGCLPPIDLTTVPNIHTLDLTLRFHDKIPETLSQTLDLLKDPFSCSIKTLIFTSLFFASYLGTALKTEASINSWDRLDTILASEAFPCLEEVKFVLDEDSGGRYRERIMKFLQTRFALTKATGVRILVPRASSASTTDFLDILESLTSGVDGLVFP